MSYSPNPSRFITPEFFPALRAKIIYIINANVSEKDNPPAPLPD